MKRLILLFFALHISLLSSAQTPAHFILGEDELSGVHIYDLHQDGSLNYWVATNNGIYKYDGYSFERIECEDMLSPSVFNISSDSSNTVYCNNLSGQIFQIKDDSCSVYYQMPDSLMYPQIYTSINSKNRLTIITNKIIQLNSDKSIKIISDLSPHSGPIHHYEDGRLMGFILHKGKSQRAIIDGDEITHLNTNFKDSTHPPGYLSAFYYHDSLMYFERRTGSIYHVTNDTFNYVSSIKSTESIFSIFKSKNNFWVPKSSLGVFQFTDPYNPEKDKKEFFKSHRISAFLEDHEGNILLGTFNHGIVVIPETQVTDIDLGIYEGKVNRICTSPKNNIVLGTADGNIASIDTTGNIEQLFPSLNSPIELLEYMPYDNSFMIGTHGNFILNLDQPNLKSMTYGTLKNICPLPNNQYLIATNNGVVVFNPDGIPFNPLTANNEQYKSFRDTHIYRGRSYSVNFDSVNRTFYLGTSSGLKIITQSGTKEMKLDGKDILSKGMLYLDGKMYVSCDNKGILIFENNEIIDHWTTENRLVSNATKLIISDGTDIFTSTDEGIQILTPDGETKWFLNKSNGLYADRVIDIELHHNNLLVLHQKGLQKIDLKALKTDDFTPNISLQSIKINNGLVSSSSTQGHFKHNQNKVSFEFSSKSLKYRNEIHYSYRLIGIEEEWQDIPYEDHGVDYKTLPPGEYEFQVKAVYRSMNSPIEAYSFVISEPFWATWWFYLTIGLAFTLVIYLYFLRLILKQRKKAKLQEELYESKLTAIQAQMNPHFIFNSLNSIQDLVLKNDAENAYNYISKFAMLVRTTLTHSDKDFIDYQDELASLELYLSLEKLRFKNSFDYEITSSRKNEIQIPPMLIQPFIENSLVHGLLHKKGQKKLSVEFELSEALICTITDNGIGREEAKSIQERQYSNHESFASSAIKKRLEILEMRYGGKFDVKYNDLHENGTPTGTQVVLKIPFLERY